MMMGPIPISKNITSKEVAVFGAIASLFTLGIAIAALVKRDSGLTAPITIIGTLAMVLTMVAGYKRNQEQREAIAPAPAQGRAPKATLTPPA